MACPASSAAASANRALLSQRKSDGADAEGSRELAALRNVAVSVRGKFPARLRPSTSNSTAIYSERGHGYVTFMRVGNELTKITSATNTSAPAGNSTPVGSCQVLGVHRGLDGSAAVAHERGAPWRTSAERRCWHRPSPAAAFLWPAARRIASGRQVTTLGTTARTALSTTLIGRCLHRRKGTPDRGWTRGTRSLPSECLTQRATW